jgi:uncharacterized membrane protein
MTNSLARHVRFLFAFAFGSALTLISAPLVAAWQMQALVGANGFFLTYLALTLRLAASTTPTDLRHHAEADDEGILLIVSLAIGAVIISLAGIIWVLRAPNIAIWQAVLALSAVPLGWATIHTLAAFRYAHLFYATKSAARLLFPGTDKPGIWDFLYFSFGIGMTAQVSDVTVPDPGIRKMVLAHAIGAFFYNAIILALAVNAGLVLGS